MQTPHSTVNHNFNASPSPGRHTRFVANLFTKIGANNWVDVQRGIRWDVTETMAARVFCRGHDVFTFGARPLRTCDMDNVHVGVDGGCT